VIIPPSILMIVWGGVISTSIGAMYLAGFLPGLLIAAAQMVTVHVYSKIYHYPVYPRATLKEFFYSAWISVPALMTAFIIVGGVLRLFPLTGITLPFISYGGSSLVTNFLLVALVWAISSERRTVSPV